jgi:hypothetical protein
MDYDALGFETLVFLYIPIIRCIFYTHPALGKPKGIVRDTGGYSIEIFYEIH